MTKILTTELAIIATGSFQATVRGLVVQGDPTFEEWAAYGKELGRLQRGVAVSTGSHR